MIRPLLTRCRNALIALCLMVSLALGACTTTQPFVPAPIPCVVTLPATPNYAFDNLAPGADIFTQVKTLLADRRQHIDHERQLSAAAVSCS